MIFQVDLNSDSDNSSPGTAQIQVEDKYFWIKLENNSREISVSIADIRRILRAYCMDVINES